jgi:hypothetical protein
VSTAGDDTIGSQKEALKTHKMMMNNPQYPFGHTWKKKIPGKP